MKGQSIYSSILSFLVFVLSITTLYFFIQGGINLIYDRANAIVDRASIIMSENIDFLNNKTSYNNPYLTIRNSGKISLDLSCFKLFVNGNLVNFNYSLRFLYPNQIANLTFSNLYIKNNSWNYINLVSCNGLRYDWTIYVI